jgi:hypothetical protein
VLTYGHYGVIDPDVAAIEFVPLTRRRRCMWSICRRPVRSPPWNAGRSLSAVGRDGYAVLVSNASIIKRRPDHGVRGWFTTDQAARQRRHRGRIRSVTWATQRVHPARADARSVRKTRPSSIARPCCSNWSGDDDEINTEPTAAFGNICNYVTP